MYLSIYPPAYLFIHPSIHPSTPITVCFSFSQIKFGNGEWLVGSVRYERKYNLPLPIIIPAVLVPMLLIIAISVICYRLQRRTAPSHNALELFVWVNVSCNEFVNSSDHLCVGGRANRQSESTRKWSISWRIWRRVFVTAAKKSSQVTSAHIIPLPWQQGCF